MASLEELAAKAQKEAYPLQMGGAVLAMVAHPSLGQWSQAWEALQAASTTDEIPAFLVALGVDPAAAQAVGDNVAVMPVGTAGLLLDDMRRAFGLKN